MNQILVGDARQKLQTIADGSVHCCVTSPPYFGLRNYGHDDQIGLERTPELFVDELVKVFREVRRVLRSDGTLWLNLGDSYAGSGMGDQGKHGEMSGRSVAYARNRVEGNKGKTPGLKPKDLIGIPWMVAFALRADGWYLRQEVIWHKPNAMPDSCKDRPTRAHEQVFLLSKSRHYFYDADAIAEAAVSTHGSGNGFARDARLSYQNEDGTARGNAAPWRPQWQRAQEVFKEKGLTDAHLEAIRACGISDTGKTAFLQTGTGRNTEEMQRLADEAKAALNGYYREFLSDGTRNARSVWTISTKPFKGSHFATFPSDLAEKCIKAGSPENGIVLDPFFGAGTTGLVAQRLRRSFVGVELNPEYAEMARNRILDDAPMFNECEVVTP